jgi:hypothetical protein
MKGDEEMDDNNYLVVRIWHEYAKSRPKEKAIAVYGREYEALRHCVRANGWMRDLNNLHPKASAAMVVAAGILNPYDEGCHFDWLDEVKYEVVPVPWCSSDIANAIGVGGDAPDTSNIHEYVKSVEDEIDAMENK